MSKEISTSTIVPAQAGWWLVIPNGVNIECAPIIAWDIERYECETGTTRTATPITASWPDVEEMGCPWAIKRPDGTCEMRGEDFVNEGHLIEYFQGSGIMDSELMRREQNRKRTHASSSTRLQK